MNAIRPIISVLLIAVVCLAPMFSQTQVFAGANENTPAAWTAPSSVAPATPPAIAPERTPARDGVFAAAANPKFSQVLNQAATEAYHNGEISRGDLARIRLAIILRPRVIAECQACVVDEAVQRGVVPASAADNVAAFDWTQMLAFIKELLPLILQIISIFSSSASMVTPYTPFLLAA